jgi:hypothetical protein
MRFNGTQWEKVDPMSLTDSSLYMVAFDDLLAGAPGATFLYAIIDKIFTRQIEIKGDGWIKSEGFMGVDGGVNGFRFSALDGLLEAIGAKFRDLVVNGGTFNSVNVNGHIDALSGTFRGEVLLQMKTDYGGVQPLIGGLRAYARGHKNTQTTMSWNFSSSIRSVSMVKEGRYEFEFNDYCFAGHIVATGHTSTVPENNNLQIWRREQINIEFSSDYYYSIINGRDSLFVCFDFKDSRDRLVNPEYIEISFLG